MRVRARPFVAYETRFFWDGVANGQLCIQQCRSCRVLRHPPSARCPSCGSPDWTVVHCSGTGSVWSFAVPRHPQLDVNPEETIFVVVELDEGVRIASNLIGTPLAAVRIGMRVEVCYATLNSSVPLPLFRVPDESLP